MKRPRVVRRRVARVLLFDQQDRLLLLLGSDPDGETYWYPPGGQIEQRESPEAAARRELNEELGLDVPDLGPVVLRRRVRFADGGRLMDQDEWHLIARVDDPQIRSTPPDDAEAAGIAELRWWSLADLRLAEDRFFPEGLVELVDQLRRDGVPAEPSDLRTR